MENYEYIRSFKRESDNDVDIDSDFPYDISSILHDYEENIVNCPRFLLPCAPETFQKTVTACEHIAEEFDGKLKATIDYSFFSATIELWCCYVEFCRGEFMSILHDISLNALSIQFTPLSSGDLHIEIRMPYFASAQVLDDE